MEKVIKIGKQEVKLSNNVAWTMEYRDQFGKDIVPVLLPIIGSVMETFAAIAGNNPDATLKDIVASFEGRAIDVLIPLFQVEFVDVAINVTWAMAKAADDDIDPPKKWVRQFETFPLDVIMPTIIELVLKGFASSKNLKRLRTKMGNLKNLQPLTSTILSSQESSEA